MSKSDVLSTPRRPSARCAAAWLGVLALCAAGPALAQLRLPQINVPSVQRLPLPAVTETVNRVVAPQESRAATVRDLLRRYPDLIEADPAGHLMRSSELVWLSPAAQALQTALEQGFVVLREQNLPELEIRQLALRPPAGLGTAQAAERLRRLDAAATVDFNHLYLRSGQPPDADPYASQAPPGPSSRTDPTHRVGLVDGGVDRRHPAFAQARIETWGCSGQEHASAHGTAVASLLVGRDRGFAGLQPGAALYAADVYCDQPAGGSAEEVARALAWMVRERVPVINISLVGPPNALLEKATQVVTRRGHLIVAAVGNDGPAAPPLYPAAYAGVVGVSGITPARRALPEAAQGPQVMFTAPGAELAVARPGGGYGTARGTSYAAPIVAGLLADALPQAQPQAAAAALARLVGAAVDLGKPGRDVVFGHGLVGESARTPPDHVSEQRR